MNVLETDVLIVGAGPAGLSAAIELRKIGVKNVLVVDREKQAGGIPRHCEHIGFGMRDLYRVLDGPAYAAHYVRLAKKNQVDILTETTITSWRDSTHLKATCPDGLAEIKASAVVLATGCRERPRSARLIPGSRPAGIMTTGALQNFVYIHDHPIGKRALVIGADHVGFSAIMTLKHAGVDVAAIITDLPHHQSYFAYKLVSADRYRVPILTDMKVSGILGKKRVEAVELTDVKTGSTQQIECDTVVFTGDWIPDYELGYAGGIEIDTHSSSPRVNLRLQTSTKGVFAVGNLIHAAETADVAALSGRYVAKFVSTYLRTGDWPTMPSVEIKIDAPVSWVSPQVIDPGEHAAPHGHFILRVMEFMSRPTLSVWQGNRNLWQKQYRQMIPNLPTHVSDTWLKYVANSAESVHFKVTR
jgi:NADPH-dependent 2,4-dienoyl-CoA reductase/sulfur reductase-like enzyme